MESQSARTDAGLLKGATPPSSMRENCSEHQPLIVAFARLILFTVGHLAARP